MSRNGSGTYTLPAGNPVVTNTTISSTWANSTLTDIASALTGSVAADGQTPITGSLNLNSNKIVNLATPTLDTDGATKAYVDASTGSYLLKASNLSDVANATTSRTNLSAAKSGANSDITSLTGLTTPLTVGQGGTGSASTTYCNLTTNVTGTLPVANGGTGVTTSTGSGANVLGTSPTIASPTISGAVVSAMASSVITSGTAVASTSGTSITFSSIPSWVKRITVLFNGVSTSGTSNLLIRLNSEATGYTGQADSLDNSVADTTGFLLTNSLTAANTSDGAVTINNFNSNVWISTGIVRQISNRLAYSVGGKTTSAVMSSIQITTLNGTDTFDAGSINILYE